MRRVATTFALALCLLGCGSKAPPGEPVQLLTGVMPFDQDECSHDFWIASELLVDPQFGTALAGWNDGTRIPVMWPPGFSARRVGSEVVVVDTNDKLVATTGQSYSIAGNPLYQTADGEHGIFRRGYVPSPIGEDMLYACGLVRPEATGRSSDAY
jgi:hypothetical protein